MSERIFMKVYEDYIAISFDVGDEQIMKIGERMNEICEEAYMNGYNWEAFIKCYLEHNAIEILEELDTDPEAGTYYAAINSSDEEAVGMAEIFKGILEDLFNDEDQIIAFLEENAEEIEWD